MEMTKKIANMKKFALQLRSHWIATTIHDDEMMT